MRECLLIVGGGLLQVPAIEIAKKMGLVVAVSDRDPDAPGLKIADEPRITDIYDIKSHLRLVDELKNKYLLRGVFTEGANAEVTVAEVAFYGNLPGIPPYAAKNCKSKVLMRRCFEKTDIPNPKWAEVKTSGQAKEVAKRIGFPLIVKAVDNCASRGSTKIFNESGIDGAFKKARRSSTTDSALIEELLEGKEQSTEIIFDKKGTCHYLNVVDRFFSKGKWALEFGHLNPSSLYNSKKEILFQLAKRAAESCGVNFGAFKIDTIWTKNGPRILECTARLSGGFDCQYTTPLATGRNFIKAALDLALGKDIDMEDLRVKWRRYSVAWAALPMPGRVVTIAGIKKALSLAGIRYVFLRVKIGDIILPYTHCAERPAFVISEGETKKQALVRAKEALKVLEIKTEEVR